MGPIATLKHKFANHSASAAEDSLPSDVLNDVVVRHARESAGALNDDDGTALLERLANHELDALQDDTSSLNHPISHYFISSSHNTYLAGNQLYGRASVLPYQYALEHACRCVEIDVWDGVDIEGGAKPPAPKADVKASVLDKIGKDLQQVRLATGQEAQNREPETQGEKATVVDKIEKWHIERVEPRVLHGHTATKEVSFRDVCRTIRDSAFKTCDLPVIVSLEVHTNHEQQQIMVDIMHSEWGDHLLDRSIDVSSAEPSPSIDSLRGKILIKVKYTPPAKAVETKRPADGNETDSSTSTDSSTDSRIEAVPKSKIIAPLSSMGVYTRSCHFSSFNQPEATLPGHIFALSEAKVHDQLEDCPTAVMRHNQHYLMRVYPKGVRVTSSNLNPLPLWQAGVQLVALNWQYVNKATMLNHAMFARTQGWVLKPSYLRPLASRDPDHHSDPLNRAGKLSLSIRFLAVQGLKLPKRCKPYIKCQLHVERPHSSSTVTKNPDASTHVNDTATNPASGGTGTTSQTASSTPTPAGPTKLKLKTPHHGHIAPSPADSTTNSMNHPTAIDFQGQGLSFSDPNAMQELSFLRIKIKNDDSWSKDELLGWSCARVKRLKEGLGTLEVYDAVGQRVEGFLLVVVRKEFVPSS